MSRGEGVDVKMGMGSRKRVVMMVPSANERGQILLLLAISFILLIAFAILAVDGGRLFVERRNAQNAADAAAMAAAFAKCEDLDIASTALLRAESNQYDNDGRTNTVVVNHPPHSGPYQGDEEHIEVLITSTIPGSIGNLVFKGPLQVTVRAVGHCWKSKTGLGSAIFAGSETCQNTVDWSASSTKVIGGVHSNTDLHIGGQTNYIHGDVTYVTTVDSPLDKVTYDPPPPDNPMQVDVREYPVDFKAEDYAPGGAEALAAAAKGKYYSCNCNMDIKWLESKGLYDSSTNQLRDGLYYASGEVDLSANNIIGNAVTFVARDTITLSGSSHQLRPYLDGILAFTDLGRPGGAQCSVAAVKLSGSSHDWSGIIFAPNGLIEMAGATNTTFNGTLIGFTVGLNGSNIHIEWDPAHLPPPLPRVDLME